MDLDTRTLGDEGIFEAEPIKTSASGAEIKLFTIVHSKCNSHNICESNNLLNYRNKPTPEIGHAIKEIDKCTSPTMN